MSEQALAVLVLGFVLGMACHEAMASRKAERDRVSASLSEIKRRLAELGAEGKEVPAK